MFGLDGDDELRGGEGRDLLAYTASLEGAARAFRRDSIGGWAAPSLLLVGRNYVRLGRHREASTTLSSAAEADPFNPKIWANLCLALSRAGALEEGMSACNEALKLERGNALAGMVKIDLLGRSGKWNEALEELKIFMLRSVAEIRSPAELDRLETVATATIDGLRARGSVFGDLVTRPASRPRSPTPGRWGPS